MSALQSSQPRQLWAGGRQRRVPVVLRRLLRAPRNLDFETAIWEMVNLIWRPRRAFRSFYHQRHTKTQWARDDPSFFVLQVLLLVVSSLLWSLIYHGDPLSKIATRIFNMIFVDFLIFGMVMATIFWLILNREYFKFKSARNCQVEWAYCFDVHCNSFLIILVALYYLQLLLLPVINYGNWIGIFVGNTLYCSTLAHYFIMTFYGYSQLPFLKNINFILFPSLAFMVLYIVSLVGINLSKNLSFDK